MLTLSDVEVAYDGVPALRAASLEVPDGSVVAVLGPSGCGKSTLLRAVAGLERPDAGRISWDGTDLAGVPTHRRGFALMFQDGQLFAHLSVARNVGYPLRLRRLPRAERDERVADLLALVGLKGYDARLPGTLSGGERQRVALARSLAADPRLLLLDEPLSSLDAGLRERLAGDLSRILREAGTTTLVVTHDQEEAFALADRLVVMREGRVVQQGATADVWAAPADTATALFLGYARVLEGQAVRRLLTAAGEPAGSAELWPAALALRRSALVVVPEPPDGAGLRGVVRSARATPDQTRLVVDVDGVGDLDAIGGPGLPVGAGQVVGLGLDRSRTAVLGPGGPRAHILGPG